MEMISYSDDNAEISWNYDKFCSPLYGSCGDLLVEYMTKGVFVLQNLEYINNQKFVI